MISGRDLQLIEQSLLEHLPVDPDLGDAPPPDDALVRALAQAVHASRSAIMLTDTDLEAPGPRLLYANPAAERLTGYTVEELMAAGLRALQGESTDRGVLDQLKRNLRSGFGFEGEVINYRRDGAPYVAGLRISPVRQEGGTVAFVAIADDNTESWLYRTQRHQRLVAIADTLRPPPAPPPVDIELVHHSAPYDFTNLGGDWSDVIEDRSGRVHLVVGDISGHGVVASVYVSRLRWPLCALLRNGVDPVEALRDIDAMNVDLGAMASVALVTISRDRRSATVITAGHPDVLVVHSGVARRVRSKFALVGSGVEPDAGEVRRVELDRGSIVCLFSDGVVERAGADSIDAGIDDLAHRLGRAPADGPLDAFTRALVDELPGGTRDDTVVLMARV